MKSKKTDLEYLPLGKGVRIIDCNEDGLLALEKPAGLMSHPNKREDEKRSLLNAFYDLNEECYRWKDAGGQEHRVDLVHRLDSATSGVMLLSLNETLTPVIKEAFAHHTVSKIYYALVKGVPKHTGGIWEDRLMKDTKNGKRIIRNAISYRAKARYQLIREAVGGFPLTLIKLMPVTGRTHQLRIQCRRHKIPILGDRTYGSFSFNHDVKQETGIKRMMLHANEILMSYRFKGQLREVAVCSELPIEFDALLDFRPGMEMGALLEQKTMRSVSSRVGRFRQ
ncbi:MAG: RNA pseudouridine synthase [Verrucomicrobia bacterium]|nr:RNA pseudouridine synthase [Verrucomicrobiota bacterium]